MIRHKCFDVADEGKPASDWRMSGMVTDEATGILQNRHVRRRGFVRHVRLESKDTRPIFVRLRSESVGQDSSYNAVVGGGIGIPTSTFAEPGDTISWQVDPPDAKFELAMTLEGLVIDGIGDANPTQPVSTIGVPTHVGNERRRRVVSRAPVGRLTTGDKSARILVVSTECGAETRVGLYRNDPDSLPGGRRPIITLGRMFPLYDGEPIIIPANSFVDWRADHASDAFKIAFVFEDVAGMYEETPVPAPKTRLVPPPDGDIIIRNAPVGLSARAAHASDIAGFKDRLALAAARLADEIETHVRKPTPAEQDLLKAVYALAAVDPSYRRVRR